MVRHPEKSKEELIQLRKRMMGYKGSKHSKDSNANRSFTNAAGSDRNMPGGGVFRSQSPNPLAFEVTGYKRSKSREPNPELIERLAAGQRVKVN